MSKTQDGTERLDIAIDLAVRAMLDVEPPAGLRGRVLHRIESPRRDGVAWVWFAAPLVAAAVIVLSILRPATSERPPRGGPSQVTVVQPGLLPPTSVPAVVTGKPERAPQPVVAKAEARPAFAITTGPVPSRAGMAATLSAFADRPATDIEPLTPIAPISVADIRPLALTHAEIAISPLTPIAELQVAPLFPPERRN